MGRLGPFIWSRAIDQGEAAQISADGEQYHLWLDGYAFTKKDLNQPRVGNVLLPRNNLVAMNDDQRFLFQPEYFNLHTRGAHNIKMVIGFVDDRLVFSHGSDSDLLHRASHPRVVVLIPVRHHYAANARMQEHYTIAYEPNAQPICVLQLDVGETLPFNWQPNTGKILACYSMSLLSSGLNRSSVPV